MILAKHSRFEGILRSIYSRLRLAIALTPLLLNLPALGDEIAIDVGHTLAAPGAISARGRPEFLFNQVLSDKLSDALKARGLDTRLINLDGLIPSLTARPEAARGSDFFISIHHDSVQASLLQEWVYDGRLETYSDRYRGFSFFVSKDNPHPDFSLNCASAMGAMMQRAGFSPARHHEDSLPNTPRPYADRNNAVHYYDNLVVLYRTTLPAVLFEAGIIKHRDEELALRDPIIQEKIADALATGIAACLFVRKAQ